MYCLNLTPDVLLLNLRALKRIFFCSVTRLQFFFFKKKSEEIYFYHTRVIYVPQNIFLLLEIYYIYKTLLFQGLRLQLAEITEELSNQSNRIQLHILGSL